MEVGGVGGEWWCWRRVGGEDLRSKSYAPSPHQLLDHSHTHCTRHPCCAHICPPSTRIMPLSHTDAMQLEGDLLLRCHSGDVLPFLLAYPLENFSPVAALPYMQLQRRSESVVSHVTYTSM